MTISSDLLRTLGAAAATTLLPRTAYVKVGYACNNRCRFCTAQWKTRRGDRTCAEIVAEISRAARQEPTGRLVLSGGEPTVRRDLPQLVAAARALGIPRVNIQTNGRRLGRRGEAARLAEAGVTSLFVSVHGATPAVHDRLCGVRGAFRQTLAGLESVSRTGLSFTTNTVVCAQNLHELPALLLRLAALPGITRAKLSYPNLQGGAAERLPELIVPLWTATPAMLDAIAVARERGLEVETEFVPPCLLGTRWEAASELRRPRYRLSDVGERQRDVTAALRERNRRFYGPCSACAIRFGCPGVHVLHHAAFGAPLRLGPLACDRGGARRGPRT